MITALIDARRGLAGVLLLLAGRRDFHDYFDVSSSGMIRSFIAAAIALPLSAFSAGVANAVAVSAEGGEPPYAFTFVVARWLVAWVYFPPLAALLTRVIGRNEAFAPWVVLNNWTHLLIVILQALAFALVLAGATPVGAALLDGSILLILYAYVMAARGALGADWTMSIFTGILNAAFMLGLLRALQMLF